MTVNVSKPAINVREKLAELDKPTGIAGEAMLRAETPQEQQALLGNFGRRNLVYNGAMKVAQRATSQTGISTTAGYYTLDRWAYYAGNSGTKAYTMSQASDGPDGFANSLKLECTTSGSVASNSNVYVRQFFEGQDLQQIGFGTSSAKHLTVSFWVKSSVTGTYTLSLYRQDNVRTSGLAYTVNSANTWEYKSLTFNPDTTGALNDDNNNSMQIAFFISAGTDLQSGTFTNGTWKPYTASEYAAHGHANVATSGDTWQITGVQLELGKVATPFEHRSYGEELALCQRYYQEYGGSYYYPFTMAVGISSTLARSIFTFPVPMRAAPTFTSTNATSINLDGTSTQTVSSLTGDVSTPTSHMMNINTSTGFGADGTACRVYGSNGTYSAIKFDAEL
jgi:hypothetical protein